MFARKKKDRKNKVPLSKKARTIRWIVVTIIILLIVAMIGLTAESLGYK